MCKECRAGANTVGFKSTQKGRQKAAKGGQEFKTKQLIFQPQSKNDFCFEICRIILVFYRIKLIFA